MTAEINFEKLYKENFNKNFRAVESLMELVKVLSDEGKISASTCNLIQSKLDPLYKDPLWEKKKKMIIGGVDEFSDTLPYLKDKSLTITLKTNL